MRPSWSLVGWPASPLRLEARGLSEGVACLKGPRGYAVSTLWWGLEVGGGRGEAGRPVKELLQDTESVPVQLGVTGVAVGRHRQRLEGRPQHFWRLDGGCGKGKARTTLALLV